MPSVYDSHSMNLIYRQSIAKLVMVDGINEGSAPSWLDKTAPTDALVLTSSVSVGCWVHW